MRSSERLPKIKTMPDYGAETVSADHTPFFRKLTSLLPAVLSLPFLACSKGTGSAPSTGMVLNLPIRDRFILVGFIWANVVSVRIS